MTMTQTENTTFLRKGKHLDYEERNKIEAWKQINRPLLIFWVGKTGVPSVPSFNLVIHYLSFL